MADFQGVVRTMTKFDFVWGSWTPVTQFGDVALDVARPLFYAARNAGLDDGQTANLVVGRYSGLYGGVMTRDAAIDTCANLVQELKYTNGDTSKLTKSELKRYEFEFSRIQLVMDTYKWARTRYIQLKNEGLGPSEIELKLIEEHRPRSPHLLTEALNWLCGQ